MRTIQATLLSLLVVCTLSITALAQTYIDPGETLSGALDIGEQDLYEFAASAGDLVLVLVTRTGGNLQVGIELYGPGPVYPFLTRTCEHLGSALLSYELPSDGTYRINVLDCYSTPGDTTGEYNITLMVLPGCLNSLVDPNGGRIESGETKTGHLGIGDMDGFEFGGSNGDRVLMLLDRTDGTLQAGLLLYGPDNLQKASSCLSIGGTVLSHQLTSDGMHRIIAVDCYSTPGDTAGGYNITLMKQPGSLNSPADLNGESIESGELKAGRLGIGDMDGFEFAGCTGETISILLARTDGTLQAGLLLYGPDNLQKASSCLSIGSVQLGPLSLPLDGTYRAIAMDCYSTSGDTTGGYHISLTKVPAPPDCCDEDADGYDSIACGGDDCVDNDASMHPGVVEQCDNGTDDNCDGLLDYADPDCPCLDNDGDNYGDPTNSNCIYSGLDCNDCDASVNPGMTEIPGNGIDDDCNRSTPPPCTPQSQVGVYDLEPVAGSEAFKHLALLLLPVGAVMFLGILRRKK